MSFLAIPAVDLIGGKCVRLLQGSYENQSTYDSEPTEQARLFQEAGFARLHIVDLEGARLGTTVNRQVIREMIASVDIPVQVGGGIRTVDDAERLLTEGATYLIIGTVVLEQPGIFENWLHRWGPEPFIVSLDLKGGKLQSRGWLKEAALGLEATVEKLQGWGIRQIICTDVEKDGTLTQPGFSTYASIRRILPAEMELFAAGGVATPEHLRRLEKEGLRGAIVGRALYEGGYALEDFSRAG